MDRLALRRPPTAAVVWVAAGLVIAVLAYLAVEVLGPQPSSSAPGRAEQVARSSAELLVDLSARNAAQTLEALRESAAGPWKEQLAADPRGVARSLRAAAAASTGTVDRVATAEVRDNKQTFLVAASATVTNTAGARRSWRSYYLVVTVEDVPERGWKVTGVEVAL